MNLKINSEIIIKNKKLRETNTHIDQRRVSWICIRFWFGDGVA